MSGKLILRLFVGLAFSMAMLSFPSGDALAQSYPNKPIRMIVPFPTGGGSDFIGRLIGQKFTEAWGQPVVVDNRPGASMMIGSEIGAKAPPDGYTIIMTSINHTINPSLYEKIPYDTVKDFTPVTLVATTPLILVVHPSLPVKSVQELITLARAKKGQLNYASSGSGGPLHLAMEMFKKRANIEMTHIPYKGSGPADLDLIAGHVNLAFCGPAAYPHVKAGKMRILGVASLKRSSEFPEVPMIAESGFPGFEACTWHGVLTPARTPREIVNKLHSEIVKILHMPDVISKLEAMGMKPEGTTPEQFSKQIQDEIAQWAKVVKDANIKIE